MKLIAVIPAFNEHDTISRVAFEVKRFVDEVIVVDDVRTAETMDEAKRLVEAGFEHVCTYQDLKLFRKRK